MIRKRRNAQPTQIWRRWTTRPKKEEKGKTGGGEKKTKGKGHAVALEDYEHENHNLGRTTCAKWVFLRTPPIFIVVSLKLVCACVLITFTIQMICSFASLLEVVRSWSRIENFIWIITLLPLNISITYRFMLVLPISFSLFTTLNIAATESGMYSGRSPPWLECASGVRSQPARCFFLSATSTLFHFFSLTFDGIIKNYVYFFSHPDNLVVARFFSSNNFLGNLFPYTLSESLPSSSP